MGTLRELWRLIKIVLLDGPSMLADYIDRRLAEMEANLDRWDHALEAARRGEFGLLNELDAPNGSAVGRNTILTPDLLDAIVNTVETTPVYPYRAAQAHGVSKSAHYNWIQRGLSELDEVDPNAHTKTELLELAALQDATAYPSWNKTRIAEALTGSIYVEYVERIATAEARLENTLVDAAFDKAETTWDIIRILERRYPDRWGRKTKIGVYETDAPTEGLVDPAAELAASGPRLEVLRGGKAS